jgi:hypothetical protein
VNKKCLQAPTGQHKVIFYEDSRVPIISLHLPGTILCAGLKPNDTNGLLARRRHQVIFYFSFFQKNTLLCGLIENRKHEEADFNRRRVI